MKAPRYSRGFIASGLVNILGVLGAFSQGIGSSLISEQYPQVFSPFGLFVIMLWGAAYISVARTYRAVPALCAVFALEKFTYVISWLYWIAISGSTLPDLFSRSPITASFFAIYGVNDLVFGLMFVAAWRESCNFTLRPAEPLA
jgi:hypothetical protein